MDEIFKFASLKQEKQLKLAVELSSLSLAISDKFRGKK
jgi:hypothetical protein